MSVAASCRNTLKAHLSSQARLKHPREFKFCQIFHSTMRERHVCHEQNILQHLTPRAPSLDHRGRVVISLGHRLY